MSGKIQSDQLEGLTAQLAAQQKQIARLEAQLEQVVERPEPGLNQTTSRRRMLRRAALGAAAGVTALSAATVLTGPQSAQAAQGVFTGSFSGDSAVTGQNTSASNFSNGVFGFTTATSGFTRGVFGRTESAGGYGVQGFNAGTTGTAPGVFGSSASPDGSGVYGLSDGKFGRGVQGDCTGDDGIGVRGNGTKTAIGVAGFSQDFYGLYGDSVTSIGGYFGGGQANIVFASVGADPRTISKFHATGELYHQNDGSLWYCVAGGQPGTWRKVNGPTSSGAMHVIDPVRLVDTRIAKGASKPVADNTTLSIQAGGVAGIPAGVTAIFGAIGIINPSNPGGVPFATLFSANLNTPPVTANLVYPGGISTSTTFAVNLGTGGGATSNKFKVFLRRITDFTIDIQGYYL